MTFQTRRTLLKTLGLSAAAAPFVHGLPSFAAAAAGEDKRPRKQRLIVMFSPNGTVPWNFWPDEEGRDFKFKEILSPLEKFKDRTLILKGVSNKIKGDGDRHMRGMSCLLTGIELFPGNIQGGSDTPAGWARGISIDQEIANFLQASEPTRTRFGSLHAGVIVPDRADPWTRMSYAGPNQPIAPIDDPYQMFKKLYGNVRDQATVRSVLDEVAGDLARVRRRVSREDRHLLAQHEAFVRKMEQDLAAQRERKTLTAVPELKAGVKNDNENMPLLSKMQIDLLVSGMINDMARIATLQFTRSVGQSRMTWLGVDETYHTLSHHANGNKDSQEKMTKINKWFCQQLAYLVQRLDQTPEPGGEGTMLDNTTIVWTNELGQGNNHTLDNIPWVLVGGGLNWDMGRSLKYDGVPHNRLLMALAHSFGHDLKTFGIGRLCSDGALTGLI